jgi:hypothetical protein
MKKKLYQTILALAAITLVNCADNDLSVTPNDSNFPLQLIVDTDEGGDLADAEEYGLEIKFADFIGELPGETVTLSYEIEGEDSFADNVEIDEVVYEVEIDNCTYTRELDFDPIAKTITVSKDEDLGTLPEAFEVVFTLPGADDTKGGFSFKITDVQSSNANIVIGEPGEFEYEVLDNELAGEWIWELTSEEDLEDFKEVFGPISPELEGLAYEDILEDEGVRIITLEFEYGEMKFEIELVEEEEICEDGETDVEHKQLEIEAEWDAEEGELELEGSHFVIGDDGEIEDELDFIVESEYSINEVEEIVNITFFKVIDEDNFSEGEELFASEKTFSFKKD